MNAQGGLLGRPVEFLFEDTQGVPANCLRKAQEMVERDRVNILLDLMASSEALAVMPKLSDWNALFISSVNGAGSITAEAWVPNAFRANTSGPMGARALALWLRNSPQRGFFSLSRDYSSFITRIRQANPQALYIALTGDDGTAFLRQAAQYRLFERMPVVTETVDMLFTGPAGDAAIGLVGGSRYSFAYDHPANNAFVARFSAEYNESPDTYDGEQWQALEVLRAAVLKAGATDTPSVVAALRDLALTEAIGLIWGADARQTELPEALAGIVVVMDEPFPAYRLLLIGAGGCWLLCWLGLQRTRLGLRWQPMGGGVAIGRLERLGLAGRARLPAGELAHGGQRLLEVAVALAQRPRLLILGEPTQGMSQGESPPWTAGSEGA